MGHYSVVAVDVMDNRILYADGRCPSGRMIHTSTLIHWLAGGRKDGKWAIPDPVEEPTKPGFCYLDPRTYPQKRVRKA